MALNHITFYSKLMEMEMGIDVIIPENKWGYSLACLLYTSDAADE